jgi:hypothetical protein
MAPDEVVIVQQTYRSPDVRQRDMGVFIGVGPMEMLNGMNRVGGSWTWYTRRRSARGQNPGGDRVLGPDIPVEGLTDTVEAHGGQMYGADLDHTKELDEGTS